MGWGRRAGRRVFQQVRRERIHLLKRNWGRVAVVVISWTVFTAALTATVQASGAGPGVTGFFLGLMVAAGIALLGYLFVLDGSTQRRMGGEAERWTSKELRRLGTGWTVFDAVSFERHDIDHVALGPSNVLVVESKWKTRWRLGDTGLPIIAASHLQQAKRNNDQIARMLRETKEPLRHHAVLFLWGGGLRETASPWFRQEGVNVVIGDRADEWRERIRDRWESRANHAARQRLEAYIRERDAHERSHRPGLIRRLLGA